MSESKNVFLHFNVFKELDILVNNFYDFNIFDFHYRHNGSGINRSRNYFVNFYRNYYSIVYKRLHHSFLKLKYDRILITLQIMLGRIYKKWSNRQMEFCYDKNKILSINNNNYFANKILSKIKIESEDSDSNDSFVEFMFIFNQIFDVCMMSSDDNYPDFECILYGSKPVFETDFSSPVPEDIDCYLVNGEIILYSMKLLLNSLGFITKFWKVLPLENYFKLAVSVGRVSNFRTIIDCFSITRDRYNSLIKTGFVYKMPGIIDRIHPAFEFIRLMMMFEGPQKEFKINKFSNMNKFLFKFNNLINLLRHTEMISLKYLFFIMGFENKSGSHFDLETTTDEDIKITFKNEIKNLSKYKGIIWKNNQKSHDINKDPLNIVTLQQFPLNINIFSRINEDKYVEYYNISPKFFKNNIILFFLGNFYLDYYSLLSDEERNIFFHLILKEFLNTQPIKFKTDKNLCISNSSSFFVEATEYIEMKVNVTPITHSFGMVQRNNTISSVQKKN